MKRLFLSILLAAFLTVAACERTPPAPLRVLQDTATHAILPLHADFVTDSNVLQQSVVAFCQSPNKAAYTSARDAWRDAMRAWQRLQTIRFGPVTLDNQAWKVQFWPDRNNLVAKQLEGMLADGEPLTARRLEAASVVMQGLTAAEYLLFDDKGGTLERYAADGPPGARRCQLLRLIAAHTQTVAARLQQGWSADGGNYVDVFTHPAEDKPDFVGPPDALAALLDSILASIEISKNNKLAEPLGLRNDLGIAQPYAVEAWRSQYSTELLLATVEGAQLLYYAGEPGDTSFAVDDLLRAEGADTLADNIDRAFSAVAASAPSDLVLFDAVNVDADAALLAGYHEALTVLTGLLKNELPPVLGITLGFNDKDGD